MSMPGFTAHAALYKTTGIYRMAESAAGAPYGGGWQLELAPNSVVPSGWGYSSIPSYPGEGCVLHRVCRFVCWGPRYPADCGYHCESECVYPIIPLPLPFLPQPMRG